MSQHNADREALDRQTEVLESISNSALQMEKSSSKMFLASVIYFAASIIIGLIAVINSCKICE